MNNTKMLLTPITDTDWFAAYGMFVSANGRQEGGAAVVLTTDISLPYWGGGGKQASNKCQWVVDGDIYDVGRWTQFTTGNIHRYKPEKLFNWQIIKAFLLKCQYILRTVRILNLFSFIVRKMNLNAEEDTSDAEKIYITCRYLKLFCWSILRNVWEVSVLL